MKYNILSPLLDLFFPPTCVVCNHSLIQQEEYVCIDCLLKLPFTRLSLSEPNLAEQKFWGLCDVEQVFALIYYDKGSPYNQLIQKLKYHNQPKLGLLLGALITQHLPFSFFESIDEIIPLPIHPNKKKLRGYNQADWIAQGIKNNTNIPIRTDRVIKVIHNTSQTRKGLYERRLNVENVYQANPNVSELEGKHILLVDDVLTTGSSLCACCQALQDKVNVKVSIVTFALTRN